MGIAIPINLGAAITPEGRLLVTNGGGGKRHLQVYILADKYYNKVTSIDPLYSFAPLTFLNTDGFRANGVYYRKGMTDPIQRIPGGFNIIVDSSATRLDLEFPSESRIPGVYLDSIYNLTLNADGTVTPKDPSQHVEAFGDSIFIYARAALTLNIGITPETSGLLDCYLEYYDTSTKEIVSSPVEFEYCQSFDDFGDFTVTSGAYLMLPPHFIDELPYTSKPSKLYLKIGYSLPSAYSVPFWLDVSYLITASAPVFKGIQEFRNPKTLSAPVYFTSSTRPSTSFQFYPPFAAGLFSAQLITQKPNSINFKVNGSTGYVSYKSQPTLTSYSSVTFADATSCQAPMPEGRITISKVASSRGGANLITGNLVLKFNTFTGVSVDEEKTTIPSTAYTLADGYGNYPTINFLV